MSLTTAIELILLTPALFFSQYFLFRSRSTFDKIYFDQNNSGVHVITRRIGYNLDGEQYLVYTHYYINLETFQIDISKKIQNDDDLETTLEELKNKTRLNLNPKYSTKLIQLKPHLFEIKNKFYTVSIYLHKRTFGKRNFLEFKAAVGSILIKDFF